MKYSPSHENSSTLSLSSKKLPSLLLIFLPSTMTCPLQ